MNRALLFGDAVKINFKTVGLTVDDAPWPLLVVTPNFYAVQMSGPTNPDDPITRLFLETGFSRLSDSPAVDDGVLPPPSKDWSGHLRSNGSWWIEYEGRLFKDRHAPEPKPWVEGVREFGHIIVYYVPEHVGEITGLQVVEALRHNHGLMVVVPVSE